MVMALLEHKGYFQESLLCGVLESFKQVPSSSVSRSYSGSILSVSEGHTHCHILMPSPVSFRILQLSPGTSFVSMAELFLSVFSFIQTAVWGLVSLPLLTECSLLIYRTAADFYASILYLAALLKAFIKYKDFLGKFWNILKIQSFQVQVGTIWLPSLLLS